MWYTRGFVIESPREAPRSRFAVTTISCASSSKCVCFKMSKIVSSILLSSSKSTYYAHILYLYSLTFISIRTRRRWRSQMLVLDFDVAEWHVRFDKIAIHEFVLRDFSIVIVDCLLMTVCSISRGRDACCCLCCRHWKKFGQNVDQTFWINGSRKRLDGHSTA